MLVFPQLGTGASALYPLRSVATARTVVNAYADGRTTVLPDTDANRTTWELHANGLTRAEWNAIETLFKTCAGAYQSFTLLDPTGNLLTQSEALETAAWVRGALVTVTTGIADPFAGTCAEHAVNAGGAAATIAQTLAAPGNFQYCLSVWARSAAGAGITLEIGTVNKSFSLTTQWQRIFMSANPGVSADTVTVAMGLAAGAAVDLYGAQCEAQPAPSDYKATGAQSGIFAARFATDQLGATAVSTDVYNAVIRVTARRT